MVVHADLAGRMYKEACGYLRAAHVLNRSLVDTGGASPFLSTLAFEVLLKTAYVLDHSDLPRHGHNYLSIWEGLKEETRNNLLAAAKVRQCGHTDFGDVDGILKDLEKTFVQARYSYEVYKDKSNAFVKQKGDDWIAAGAKEEDADFNYRALECDSLVFAVGDWIQDKLGFKKMDLLSL